MTMMPERDALFTMRRRRFEAVSRHEVPPCEVARFLQNIEADALVSMEWRYFSTFFELARQNISRMICFHFARAS